MISFSVVIPTLNESENIAALLRALSKQEYCGSWEIIVADGNSNDGTLEIAREFAIQLSKQRSGVLPSGLLPSGVLPSGVLQAEIIALETARGVSRQRNAGARKATGELLVFMDADDLPAPDFLAKVARSHKRIPFAVACPWFVADDSGLFIRALYVGFNVLFFIGQSWLRTGSGVCLILRRSVFEKIGGFDESLHLGEDVQLIRRASRFGLHRHLCIPLKTSGRRFRQKGAWKLMLFYARISPHILLGRWRVLQKFDYQAAPYENDSNDFHPENKL